VAVDVDHRMVEPAPHLGGTQSTHARPPINARSSIRG
jgi:hypothetical protein